MRPPGTRRRRTGVIGYAPGGYDLFHIGHLQLLARSWGACDYLVAGVATDEVLQQMKRTAPAIPLEERLAIVDSVSYVDLCVVDTSPDKLVAWHEVRFDILFKGDDWRGTPQGARLEQDLATVGARVVYFPYTASTSSTQLRAWLHGAGGDAA
ncbi:MAG: adenylyltransferase/cytidyltransferase family protein [Kineosporiaceae bacterium]